MSQITKEQLDAYENQLTIMIGDFNKMIEDCLEDQVKKEGLRDKIDLYKSKTDDQIDSMARKDIIDWHEKNYDKVQKEELEYEELSKSRKQCIGKMKELVKVLNGIIEKEDLMTEADKVNINNYKLELNFIVEQMKEANKRGNYDDLIVKVDCNEHVDPKLSQCNKYFVNNMNKLEEWSGLKFKQVLYDSERDGKSSEIFRNKTLNHSHLYFIVIDSVNNIFGHYHPDVVTINGRQSNIFLFTLNSNGRCGVKKFEKISRQVFTMIWRDKGFFDCAKILNKSSSDTK